MFYFKFISFLISQGSLGEGRSSILWVDDSPEAPAEVKVKPDVDDDVDDDGDDNKDGDDGRQLRGTS